MIYGYLWREAGVFSEAQRLRGVQSGYGNGYSVLDLVKTFEKVNGVEIPYEIVGRRAGDIATCYADPSKAEALLGWKVEKGIGDMCRESWRWQQRQ